MKKKILFISLLIGSVFGLGACNVNDSELNIVVTTTMLTDLTEVIVGEDSDIKVEGLMGSGIDPHLYKPSAGDLITLNQADLIVYNGLHLEGEMTEVFEDLEKQDKLIVEIGDAIPEEDLIVSDSVHDPHIWYDVELWKVAALEVKKGIVALDPDNESVYQQNYEDYLEELDALDTYVQNRVLELEEDNRILITAHDAFNYFGTAYGFDVMGLQGISTVSESSTADITSLANFIVENEIKAIFVETSVSNKSIMALQEAVKAKNFDVVIGGELYSDSLGDAKDGTDTYIETVKSNVDTIVDALK